MWAKFLILYDWILARFGTCVAVGTDEYKQILRVLNPTNLIIVRNPVPKIVWELNDNPFDFGFVIDAATKKVLIWHLKFARKTPLAVLFGSGMKKETSIERKIFLETSHL